MTTRVVNLRLDPFDVYIGRAGKGQDGYFGNPHPVGSCRRCTQATQRPISHDRLEALDLFLAYFCDRIGEDPEFRQRVLELRGKVLGCFCAPKGGLTAADPHVCHGQVIAEWVDGQEVQP